MATVAQAARAAWAVPAAAVLRVRLAVRVTPAAPVARAAPVGKVEEEMAMNRTNDLHLHAARALAQGQASTRAGAGPNARGGNTASTPVPRRLAAGAAVLALGLSPLAAQAADGGPGIAATGGAQVLICSTVRGGLGSDGSTRAPSVLFSGGGNALTLQVGYALPDGVSAGAGDTLALGGASTSSCPGSVDGSFDVSTIGGAGPLQGFGSFAKTGPSTWALTGSNPATTWAVQGGTLKVNGAIGGASATGGTLGGSGNAGALQLGAGGVLAPGNSPGTLHGTSLIWDGGGAFQFELGANAADSDLLALTGALTKGAGGGFVFHFADGTGAPVAGRYTLITFANHAGFAVGDFSFDYSGGTGGLQGRFELKADALDFVVTGLGAAVATPIPTMSEAALALLAALLGVSGWAGTRRGRRRESGR